MNTVLGMLAFCLGVGILVLSVCLGLVSWMMDDGRIPICIALGAWAWLEILAALIYDRVAARRIL